MRNSLKQSWDVLTLGSLVGGLAGYFLGAHLEEEVHRVTHQEQKEAHKRDLKYVEEKAEDYRQQLFDVRAKIPDLVDEKARALWESLQQRTFIHDTLKNAQPSAKVDVPPIPTSEASEWEQSVWIQPEADHVKRQTVNAIRDLDAYRATLSPAEREVLEAWKSLLTNRVVESADARVAEIPAPYRESFLQAIRSRESTQSIEQIAEKRALQIMQQQDLQILTENAAEVDGP